MADQVSTSGARILLLLGGLRRSAMAGIALFGQLLGALVADAVRYIVGYAFLLVAVSTVSVALIALWNGISASVGPHQTSVDVPAVSAPVGGPQANVRCLYSATGAGVIFHSGVLIREGSPAYQSMDERYCDRPRPALRARMSLINCRGDPNICLNGHQHGYRCLYALDGEGVIYSERQIVMSTVEGFAARWSNECSGLASTIPRGD